MASTLVSIHLHANCVTRMLASVRALRLKCDQENCGNARADSEWIKETLDQCSGNNAKFATPKQHAGQSRRRAPRNKTACSHRATHKSAASHAAYPPSRSGRKNCWQAGPGGVAPTQIALEYSKVRKRTKRRAKHQHCQQAPRNSRGDHRPQHA